MLCTDAGTQHECWRCSLCSNASVSNDELLFFKNVDSPESAVVSCLICKGVLHLDTVKTLAALKKSFCEKECAFFETLVADTSLCIAPEVGFQCQEQGFTASGARTTQEIARTVQRGVRLLLLSALKSLWPGIKFQISDTQSAIFTIKVACIFDGTGSVPELKICTERPSVLIRGSYVKRSRAISQSEWRINGKLVSDTVMWIPHRLAGDEEMSFGRGSGRRPIW